MTDAIIHVARFTENLLSYNHDLILRGRENFERVDFSQDYIVVDELASIQVSSTEKFIGDESRYIKTLNMVADITMNFYGDNALSNAQRWSAIKGLQPGRELQQTQKIQILQIGNIANLKQIAGTDYGNRYEISVKVWYNIEEEIEINPIETTEFNFLNNK